MLSTLNKWRRAIGMDKAVFYTAGGRGWTMASGLVTLVMVGTQFSREVQGYYYTFASVMSLQLLLELGLSQSLIQFASHECSRLVLEPDGRLSGDPAARARLQSLGRLAVRWYGILSLLVLGVIGGAGHWFFSSQPHEQIEWMAPWWLFCLGSALNLCLTPYFFLLEGCNQVASVNRCRLIMAISSSLSAWTAMACGAQLYTCVAASFASFIPAAIYLWRGWPGFLRELAQAPAGAARQWIREIWPFQWRISISWASGFFIFSLFTPVLFKFHGPVVAGQMGMSWQAVSAVGAIAAAWNQSKAPLYGMLISRGQIAELNRLFRRATVQSIMVAAAGVAVLLAAVAGLKAVHPLGQRFLDLPALSLLAIATVAGQLVTGMAVYLRAHKQEPFMVVSVASAVAMIAGLIVLGKPWGGFGAALAYAISVIIVSLPMGACIFKRKKAEWHPAAGIQT